MIDPMTDPHIDLLLARMGAAPPDPRLAMLEDAVLAGLRQAQAPVIARAGLGAVAALALMLGVMASAVPSGTHPQRDPLASDGLAPSTLLAEAK